MYTTFKYARKQYRGYQARRAAEQQGHPADSEPYAHNGVPFHDTTALTTRTPTLDVSNNSTQEPLNKPSKETPEERAEKTRRRKYRWKIIVGLFAPYTLQALDTTIVASAVKFIADDFGQLHQLNWIITAFNLTSAAFLPVFAQLADVFGRHATLQTALVIILVGSALCTASPVSAFPLLLLGRALQGVGAAGINICVRTILADRVSLADYAKNWTVFALLSAVSFSIGPVAGGYLTQASWRWCFAINLPVGVVGIGVLFWLLRGELVPAQDVDEVLLGRGVQGTTRKVRFFARLGTIDYGGQLLFLWGLGLLVLAFTWAGAEFPWDSTAVLVSLVVGGVMTVAWLVYEWAMVPGRLMARVFPMQKAMMPWELLMQRDIGLLFLINFAIGVAMYSVMYFMDLYFTLVQGHSASRAGVGLLFFLPGLGGKLSGQSLQATVY
jgi:MFS family permease